MVKPEANQSVFWATKGTARRYRLRLHLQKGPANRRKQNGFATRYKTGSAKEGERAAEWERVGKAAFLTLDEQREALGYGPAPKQAFVAKRDVGLERRYSPDQPRVPAGNSGAGQWTSGGGGGDLAVWKSAAREMIAHGGAMRRAEFGLR